MRAAAGNDVTLEEQLASFTVADFGASRIQRIDAPGSPSWNAPDGLFIEDAALHPSGAVSAVLVDADFGVWLARLGPDLALLQLAQLEDPAVATDPFPDAGIPPPTTLVANSLPRDSVRAAADGEDVVVAVTTTLESVLLYRVSFTTDWEAPRRKLRHLRCHVVLVPSPARRRPGRECVCGVLGRSAEAPASQAIHRR